MKTSTIVLLAVGALVALYLFTKKSAVTVRGTTTSGLGSTLAGVGAAATGISNLWDSASNSWGSDSSVAVDG